MRLLVLCPHFAPDAAPTGEVMTAIVEELATRGHRLHVVSALPWYVDHRIEPGWGGAVLRHQDVAWGRITRVHPFPTDKGNIPARAAAFAGFTGLAGLVAVASRGRPDAVLAMSPPLTLGAAGWAVARARRVPFVFNVQDVFPDVAVELGALTNPAVISLASTAERLTYQGADAVTVLSEDLRANLVAKLAGHRRGEATKVRVIPNFVDTHRIRPASRRNAYRAEHDLGERTVVMYAGNVGLSQSLDLVLAAASATVDDPSVVFVINGGGSALAELRERGQGLPNLRFVGLQPRERLPEVLAAADVHVVPLRRGLARSSVPSKLYSILAAARPIVASVDPGTEVARTVAAAGAGLAVPPEDPEAFTEAIRRLVRDPAHARRQGESGRRWVEAWASPAAVAASYEDLFAELGAPGPRSGRTAPSE